MSHWFRFRFMGDFFKALLISVFRCCHKVSSDHFSVWSVGCKRVSFPKKLKFKCL